MWLIIPIGPSLLFRIFINEHSQTVIGANVMAGHDVLFDTDGASRIGFAVSNCSYNQLLESNEPVLTDSQPTGAPTRMPTISKSPSGNAKNDFSDSNVGLGFVLVLLMVLFLVLILIIKRRRNRVQRGRYRQTIGLDELELDENEDLELPPVL
jgi:hypothetical protein